MPEGPVDPAGAVSDSAYKIIRDLGPVRGTLIVVVILLAASFFKWFETLRNWFGDSDTRKLAWAKWDVEKAERDAALRAHGALTQEALHNLVGKPPKVGDKGVDDHG